MVITFVLIVLIITSSLLISYVNKDRDVVKIAEAAKVIAEADTEAGTFSLNKVEGYWYEPYMEYVNELGLFTQKNAKDLLTYKDVCEIIDVCGADFDEIQRQVDFKINAKGNIKKGEFADVFNVLKDFLADGDAVFLSEFVLISENENTEVVTDKGRYSYFGIDNGFGMDSKITAITKDSEILMFVELISKDVEYKNVWIENVADDRVVINLYGVEREYKGVRVSENVTGVLGDITVKDGRVKKVSIKDDVISGKVLSVTDKYVEISGYGEVLLDEFFRIYNFVPNGKNGSLQDIIVGYDLQEFIVAEGKICGVVISEKLVAENIRVIIKSTGFKSIAHDTVTLSSDAVLVLNYGDELENVEALEAGQEITITKEDERLKNGRIKFTVNDGEIFIKSIERAQGIPGYSGDIELMLYDEGIVIVNELNVEDYLKKVVPSEMPTGYGVEALKVQAVCARNYAYRQIENNKYSMYGAHVDDSTSFQVYNNTNENAASNQAIAETVNEVLQYNEELAMTYYYSTSCGSGTDSGVWGSNPAAMPYLVNKAINGEGKTIDYASEEAFRSVIKEQNSSDYDYGCTFYRWDMETSGEELSKSFNAKLADNLNNIQVLGEDNTFVDKEVESIGVIKDIEIVERSGGGAIKSMIVTGTEATVKLTTELCVRKMFGNEDKVLYAVGSERHMNWLPSAFCIFETEADDGVLKNVKIIGGGYGHGIGMSQNAVKGMVTEGKTYSEILEFFFPGTKLGKVKV